MNQNPNEAHASTQAEQILAHLRAGNKLTSLEAIRLFGCMRLAAVVYDLRREGHDISGELIPVEVAGGKIKRVSQYRRML